jgi:serine/threonine protein kinase
MSTIFVMTHTRSNIQFAIKYIHKDRCRAANVQDILDLETNILDTVDHPFIAKYFWIEETEDSIYVVMEFASGETC